MLSLKIAWRFLRSSPGQSILIIGGIAVGIATQIFVGSLIVSLQDSLIDQTIGSAPQVTVQNAEEGESVAYTERMRSVITGDSRVRPGTIVPVRNVSALYTDNSDSAPLNLIGGNLGDIDGIYRLSERTIEGEATLRGDRIMIGREFAERYSLRPGDSLALTFPAGRRGTYRVAGIFDLGAAQFNERQAFVAGSVPADVLGWGGNEFSAIQVQMREPFESAEVAADWRRRLPELEIVEWQAQNADLLVALQSQSTSSYLIQTFVLVAVALGIASTLAIAAVQKTRQIGILKAMGLSDARAGRIFLWQAAILGVGGSTGGVALAFGLLGLFALAPVPFSIVPQWWFVAASMGVGIGVALASSIIPTRSTSKLDPIEVIQGG